MGTPVPIPLGFIAFRPGFLGRESELDWKYPPSRNPGSRVGAPVASLRRRILRSGLASILLPGSLSRKKCLLKPVRQGINTLVLAQLRWPVLKWPRMAGFHVATEGRKTMSEQEKPKSFMQELDAGNKVGRRAASPRADLVRPPSRAPAGPPNGTKNCAVPPQGGTSPRCRLRIQCGRFRLGYKRIACALIGRTLTAEPTLSFPDRAAQSMSPSLWQDFLPSPPRLP
jgi:hypothetical protein